MSFLSRKKEVMTNAMRRRFVKDYNLPISIVDSPYFEYYKELYDWFPIDDYNETLEAIKEAGSDNAFLERYAKVRDEIITTVENSESFQKFNNCNMEKYKLSWPNSQIGDKNIYTNDSVGKEFFSIDLKKANFQALKYVDPEIVNFAETYDDFINSFTEFPYISKSKYTRQVIFGKLNPKRTIAVEKYIMSQIYEYVREEYDFIFSEMPLEAIKSDELIFSVGWVYNIDENVIRNICFDIYKKFGIDVRCEYFKVGIIETKNSNGITVPAYIRKNLLTGEETLKCASMIYYPQFYKFLHNEKINKKDLVFMSEGQPARFLNPLKLVRIER